MLVHQFIYFCSPEREAKKLVRISLGVLNFTYAKLMTIKSSQFQASLKYVNDSRTNPLAITFTADSNV